jgi:hypothetical protein
MWEWTSSTPASSVNICVFAVDDTSSIRYGSRTSNQENGTKDEQSSIMEPNPEPASDGAVREQQDVEEIPLSTAWAFLDMEEGSHMHEDASGPDATGPDVSPELTTSAASFLGGQAKPSPFENQDADLNKAVDQCGNADPGTVVVTNGGPQTSSDDSDDDFGIDRKLTSYFLNTES